MAKKCLSGKFAGGVYPVYCEYCAYFQRPDDSDSKYGLCRRHPPQCSREENDGLYHTDSFWPRVHIKDWCGEGREHPGIF